MRIRTMRNGLPVWHSRTEPHSCKTGRREIPNAAGRDEAFDFHRYPGHREHACRRAIGGGGRPRCPTQGGLRHRLQDPGERGHSRQFRSHIGALVQEPEHLLHAPRHAAGSRHAGRHSGTASVRQSARRSQGASCQRRALHSRRDLQGASGRHVGHTFAFTGGDPAQPDGDQDEARHRPGWLSAAGNPDLRNSRCPQGRRSRYAGDRTAPAAPLWLAHYPPIRLR